MTPPGTPFGSSPKGGAGEPDDVDVDSGTIESSYAPRGPAPAAHAPPPSGDSSLGTSPPTMELGDVIDGRGCYRLVAPLGRGGMGAVYLADVVEQPPDEAMPEQVAVKVMPGSASSVSSYPRGEIGVMKALRHANIVRLYDYRLAPERSFAVMDYQPGGSLLDHIRAHGALDLARSRQLAIEILSALVVSHSRGLLHLDIKPANVLIGSDGRFLLTDFGIAGSIFQQRARQVIGTPAFMSPEQARGEMDTLDARSDLYMLGSTLWIAMTADFSVVRRAPMMVVAERRTSTFPLLCGRVAPELQELARVVDHLLVYDARERPGTAAEVLHLVRNLGLGSGDTTINLATRVVEGEPLTEGMASAIERELTDPLLRELLRMEGTFFEIRVFRTGQLICAENECTFSVYVLLAGGVEVIRSGQRLAIVEQEGAILGEVAALVGSPRTATLAAIGETTVAVFKGAELEQACRRMPALAVRIMKNLAAIIAERDLRT